MYIMCTKSSTLLQYNGFFMHRLSLSYGFISCVYVHGLVSNNIHTKAKVNGVTLDAGVMTGSCLLFRNGVKVQLNIDTVVCYERY